MTPEQKQEAEQQRRQQQAADQAAEQARKAVMAVQEAGGSYNSAEAEVEGLFNS
jgi:hypothetical protein